MNDDFPIIDCHHHLWDLENHRYSWLQDGVEPIVFGDYAPLCKSYLLDDFLADARHRNVVKSVQIDVGYDPANPFGETEWLQALADERGYPHGIVGYADLSRPDVDDLLARHGSAANFRGVRQSLNSDPDPAKTYLSRPGVSREADWRRGFARLREHRRSFDLQIYWPQMEECLDLARAFPDQQIILCHTGMPVDHSPDGFANWRQGMKRLSRAPNVACKISGLGMGNFSWRPDDFRPWVLTAIECFGVERCMYASNFPVDKLFSSYGAISDTFAAITHDFSPSDRRKLFHDNAQSFYRL